MTDQVLQNTTNLGADHLTFDGEVGDFEKKIPARQFRIKKYLHYKLGEKYPTQYLVEKMLQNYWWFAIKKTGAQFFPGFILTVCKLKPEILNIIKYPLIV